MAVSPEDDQDKTDKIEFLYSYSRYYGEFSPQNLAFDANLQEFAQRVGYITALETSGKLSSQDAYGQIKALWERLKTSKKELGIGEEPSAET